MATQNAFGEGFTPVVRVGENLELQKSDTESLGYYKVLYIEPLPHHVHDFGALNTVASTGDTEVTDLYMPDGELAQYWIVPLDDIEVTVSQPKARKRYATKNYVHIITPFIWQVAPQLTRIYMWEDEKVYFDVKNPTKYNRAMHRFLTFGWRLILKKLSAKPPQSTPIPIEGA